MNTIVKEIINTIKNDSTLQNELSDASSETSYVGIIIRVSKSLGKAITPEAVRSYLAENQNEELSSMELETIVGGNTIIGTEKNDWLNATNSGDMIEGRGGNDMIFGGNGDDTILAGDGKDHIMSGSGDDRIEGGDGNDRIFSGYGADRIEGGDGNDTMWGGGNKDTMFGDNGDDTMGGGNGADIMYGGAGNDIMYGSYGNDRIDGGDGNDIISGGNDNDILTGGSGADVFVFEKDSSFTWDIADTGDNTITDFNVDEDRIELQGVESENDFSVSTTDGDTVISFKSRTITVENVELTSEQILAMQKS